jgi:hypothetical protein
MRKRILIALALVCAAAPALAQVAEGQPYAEARAALLHQGWKPDESFGQKLANGKPLYHYPEVVCGPQRCHAKWRDAAGKERKIELVRGVNQDHRVGPN